MGTNIFFDISENQSQSDVFGRKASIQLDYFTSQTKVLNLEPVKIKPRKADIQEEQLEIKYNLKWDYDTLLKKWDEGTLELKDMIKDMKVIPLKEKLTHTTEEFEERMDVCEPVQVSVDISADEDELSTKELQEQYQYIKCLARRPVRRKPEKQTIKDCEDRYKDNYELHNLKKQVSNKISMSLII